MPIALTQTKLVLCLSGTPRITAREYSRTLNTQVSQEYLGQLTSANMGSPLDYILFMLTYFPHIAASLLIFLLSMRIIMIIRLNISSAMKRDMKLKYQMQGVCKSKNCVRCNASIPLIETAKNRMGQLINYDSSSDFVHLKHFLSSRTRESVYNQTIVRGRVLTEGQAPTVFFLDGLSAHTIWTHSEEMFELIEATKSLYKRIRMDYYSAVAQYPHGWMRNSIPCGSWDIFPLIQQGEILDDNCMICHSMQEIFQVLSPYLLNNAFGNMSFSILHPNSKIEKHTGPTNMRLRVHLGLNIPGKASINVNDSVIDWKEGAVDIFDDSFIHQAVYEKPFDDKNFNLPSSENNLNPLLKSRGIFMFDIWHPEVELNERKALDHLFKI